MARMNAAEVEAFGEDLVVGEHEIPNPDPTRPS